MSATLTSGLMTAEEFLALPDDGMERMLIRGHVWEKPMTRRNRWHSRTEAYIAHILQLWLREQKKPRGEVYSGEAGFLLRGEPSTVMGIDVAYVSAEVAARDPRDTTLIDGAPILAVEILSPSDKHEEITAKVDDLLAAGTALVWVVDPHFETIVVHRPGAHPEMFTGDEILTAEPHLPGFQVRAADIFGD